MIFPTVPYTSEVKLTAMAVPMTAAIRGRRPYSEG